MSDSSSSSSSTSTSSSYRWSYNGNSSDPSQSLINDVLLLNSYSPSELKDFISNVLLTYLVQSEDQENALNTFIQNNSELISNTSKNMTRFKNSLLNLLNNFFSMAVRQNIQQNNLKNDLVQMGLSSDRAEVVASEWSTRFSSLSSVQLAKTLKVNSLLDISWKFGVTASSSDLSTVGTTFLQLSLLVDKGGNVRENVVMELTLPQFYTFLQQMQVANKHMQNISKA